MGSPDGRAARDGIMPVKQRGKAWDLGEAIRAALAEAEGQPPITFTYGNEEFTAPPPDLWDLDTFSVLQTGDVVAALKLVLGDEEWARLARELKEQRQYRMGVARVLLERIGAAAGVGLGESSASGSSSTATMPQ